MRNVIAADLIGRFPEPNVAEALQRVPAVSIQRDQGEGRYVQIRGTEPRLTSVKINGVETPSPEGDVRYVALDVIPADQLAAIEVDKALTPEMDADAIGGIVNLVTKSALGNRPTLRATFAGGLNQLESEANYQGSLSYGRRVNEGRLGYLLSGSIYSTDRCSDNAEMEWGDETFGGDPEKVLQDLQLRDYTITRRRISLNGDLEYRLGEDSQVFLKAFYNRFTDQEFRRRLRYRFDEGDYLSATQVSEGVIERELKDRYEAQNIYSLSAGGNQRLAGVWKLDYNLSYSYAEEEEPNRRDIGFALEDVDLSYSAADPDEPRLVGDLDALGAFTPGQYEFDELVYEDNLTTDKNWVARLDLSRPYALGAVAAEGQVGAKFRRKSKDRRNDVRIYDWEGDDNLTMDRVAGGLVDEDFLDGLYSIGQSPDPDRVESLFNQERDKLFEEDIAASREDSDPANYDATEDILAAYAQTRLDMGRWDLLLGLRYERTDLEYTGNEVLLDSDGDYAGTNPVSGANDYGDLFPMLHARYRIDDRTNIRAAATTSIARPNYYDLAPYRIVNEEDEEVERFADYEVTHPTNGRSADLFGLELNWQQELSFLPGALNGLGANVNYTFTSSEAELVGRADKVDLPGQAASVANISLSYEKHGFAGRLALTRHGAYIAEVGEDSEDDIYIDSHAQLDRSFNYRIMPRVRIFAEAINLTDEPLRVYQGTSDRPIQREFYSWWSHIGLKYDL